MDATPVFFSALWTPGKLAHDLVILRAKHVVSREKQQTSRVTK